MCVCRGIGFQMPLLNGNVVEKFTKLGFTSEMTGQPAGRQSRGSSFSSTALLSNI